MNEKLFELLNAFGEELKVTPVVKEYNEARNAYTENKELTALVREYNVQNMMLKTESEKENKNEEAIKHMEARVAEITELFTNSPIMIRFNEAEDELNALLSDINARLSGFIVPDSGCGGNCHSCGGCH